MGEIQPLSAQDILKYLPREADFDPRLDIGSDTHRTVWLDHNPYAEDHNPNRVHIVGIASPDARLREDEEEDESMTWWRVALWQPECYNPWTGEELPANKIKTDVKRDAKEVAPITVSEVIAIKGMRWHLANIYELSVWALIKQVPSLPIGEPELVDRYMKSRKDHEEKSEELYAAFKNVTLKPPK